MSSFDKLRTRFRDNAPMPCYVAFLRGINLGPTNKIAMPALREMATGLGYTDVATYINSGNLIFDSTKRAATLEREIAAAIQEPSARESTSRCVPRPN